MEFKKGGGGSKEGPKVPYIPPENGKNEQTAARR